MSKDQNSMLSGRHQELLQALEAKGQMGVDELSFRCGVSHDTIRRDLQLLEGRRLLLRTHGGAVSTAFLMRRETPFLSRANADAYPKAPIGRAAAQLISDDETLIINGGSATLAFAASLGPRRNLTIVTNNVAILSVVPGEALRGIYLLGGQYRFDLGSTVDPVGFSSGDVSVDTAVLGVSGLTEAEGLSTTFMEEVSMLGRMIASARRAIVLAEASKFGHNAFAPFAPLDAIDVLVTDASPPEDVNQALSQANVEVIVASPTSIPVSTVEPR